MIELTAALSPAQQQAVTDLAASVESADGVAPLNDAARFAVRGQRAATHVLALDTPAEPGVAGDLVGYAHVDSEDHSVVLMVHPQHRRQGMGTSLLDQVRASGQHPTVWAFGNSDAARALARSTGLELQRELLVMRRDLSQHPVDDAEATRADGVRIDTFTPAELGALVHVNATAFAEHPEQGHLSEQDFRDRMAEPWFDPTGLFLARDEGDGRVIGFHWTKVDTDPVIGHHGEVYAIGVLPEAGGRGVGRALLGAGLAHLQAVGVPQVILYVEAEAERTVQMYRAAGFDDLSRDASYAWPRSAQSGAQA